MTQHASDSGKQLIHSLWMLFAAFVFAIMSMCVKLAASLYSTSEIVMYRGAIGMVILSILVLHQGGSLRTTMPNQHLWRGVVGVTALWLWFYSISLLPLATANTLNYMAPIWIAAILFVGGWWHAKKHLEWPLVAAIGMSFVGVTLLLQPVFHARLWSGAIMGLVSGVLSALAYLQVRRLGQLGEPEYRVVFYFSVVTLVAGLLGTSLGGAFSAGTAWHSHTPYGIALLLAIGLSAAVAQMAMTRAYRLGKTLVVANLQYTGIVFSSMWGMLVWGDNFDWHGWLGMGVILFSGIAATFYNNRNVGPAATRTDPIASET